MKKGLIALILALSMLLSLSACSGDKAPSSTPAPSNTAEPAPVEDKTPGWPEKTMTIIMATNAGSSNDMAARTVGTRLGEILGTTIVFEYVPGGGQWNGWSQLIRSEPDGNTFTYIAWPSSSLAQYNELNPQPYNRDNFINLTCQVFEPSSIAIRTDDTRYTDMESFIEYAREHEVISTCGANSIANGDFSFTHWLNVEYGTNITVMPVESSAAGYAAFIAGDSDVYIGNPGDYIYDIETGMFKVLGIAGKERLKDYPDIPTFIEQGFDFSIGTYRGFAFPAGVDEAIVEEMRAALLQVQEETEDDLRACGLNPYTIYGQELEDTITDIMQTRLDAFGLDWDDTFA